MCTCLRVCARTHWDTHMENCHTSVGDDGIVCWQVVLKMTTNCCFTVLITWALQWCDAVKYVWGDYLLVQGILVHKVRVLFYGRNQLLLTLEVVHITWGYLLHASNEWSLSSRRQDITHVVHANNWRSWTKAPLSRWVVHDGYVGCSHFARCLIWKWLASR